MALTKIPGTLIQTGAITAAALDDDAVTTAKVLDANITHAKLHATMDLTGKTVTVATAAGSTNTTAAASTAFVQQELTSGLAPKATIASPTFTGTPSAPTASGGTNTTTLASTAFVQQELTTLIGGAPSTLNDLNELAAAINDDANYNSTLTTALGTKLPLAGGTMTGNIVMGDNNITGINKLEILDSADNNRLEIYGNASNGFIFDMGGTGSTGTINFNDFNVGIGETTPANLLHVKASDTGIAPHPSAQIVLEREGTNYLQFLTAEAGTSGILFGDGSDIDVSKIYVDHNTTKMTFVNETIETMTLNGNKVGIGTTSPDSLLEINAPSSGHNSSSRVATITAPVYPSLEFYSTNTNTNNRNWKLSSVYNSYGTFEFLQSSAANGVPNQTVMAMTKDGNVGIGTHTPAQKLEVDGDIRIKDARSLFFKRHGDNYAWRIRNESAASGGTYGFNGSNDLVFEVVSNSEANATPAVGSHSVYPTSANTLVLQESGKVGIGTAAPAATLHIKASSPTLTLETSANSNDPLITLKSNSVITNEGAQIYYDNSEGTLHLTTTYANAAAAIKFHTATGADRATNNVRMTIGGAGDVSIGGTPSSGGSGSKWLSLDANSGNAYSGGLLYKIGGAIKAYHYVENNFIMHQTTSGVGQRFYAGTAVAMTLNSAGDLSVGVTGVQDSPHPLHKKVEVTAAAATSNAWSTNAGSNGGYDVSNNDTAFHQNRGSISAAGYYNNHVAHFSLRGNFAANTWYPFTTRTQLQTWIPGAGGSQDTGMPMYFRVYTYDVSAGGGDYLSHRLTDRFWFTSYSSNSTQRHQIPLGPAMGHAPNRGNTTDHQDYGNNPIQVAINHRLGTDSYYAASQTFEIWFNQARTGLTGAGALQVDIYAYIG